MHVPFLHNVCQDWIADSKAYTCTYIRSSSSSNAACTDTQLKVLGPSPPRCYQATQLSALSIYMTPLLLRFSTSLLVATGICSYGLRKRSLSPSGAAAAFNMGVLHMTCGWTFGLVLICFFATSSKLTKFRQEQKAKLDAHIKPGGQRNALQVLCNSLPGAAAALLACITSPAAGGQQLAVQLAAWCAFLGHYSCCCADTWASELGMLSSSSPRLITHLQARVPPGVNGGVTGLGVAASAAGGLCMGAAVAVLGWLTGDTQPLAHPIQQALSQQGLLLLPGPLSQLLPDGVQQALFWCGLSLLCGLVGSVVDSLLGATVQFSGFDRASGKVVGAPGPGVRHISGRAWLSNDAVNATSALLTSCGAAAVGALVARQAGM